jgi:hypothetical protein
LIDSRKFIDRFNTFKYQILAQDFKLNLSELFNLQCLGIKKMIVDTQADGFNIEAVGNDNGA